MASLYCITHVRTTQGPFSWTLAEVDDHGILDPGAVIVWTLAGERELDQAIAGDFATLYAWTKAQLAQAGDAQICTIIADMLSGSALSPSDTLAHMTEPRFNLWEYSVPVQDEDSIPRGKDLLFLQWLLHQVFPERFALPFLAQVSVYGFDIHPDAAEFKISDASMAVRALMDQRPDHPLSVIFREQGENDDCMFDIIFRIESVGGANDVYAFWLPAHLTGTLPDGATWDSTAFPLT